jgi:hypothetical protein
VAIFTTLTKVIAKERYPKEPNSPIFLTIGNAPFAVPAKKCLNHWANTILSPKWLDIKIGLFYEILKIISARFNKKFKFKCVRHNTACPVVAQGVKSESWAFK